MTDYLLRALEGTVALIPLAGAVVDLAMVRDPNEALYKFREVVNAVTDLTGEDGAPSMSPTSRPQHNLAFERAARQRRARLQRERMLNARMSQARSSTIGGCAWIEEVVDDAGSGSTFELPLHPPSDSDVPVVAEECTTPPPSNRVTTSPKEATQELEVHSTSDTTTELESETKTPLTITTVESPPPSHGVSSLEEKPPGTPHFLSRPESMVLQSPDLQSSGTDAVPADVFSPIPPVTDIMEQMEKTLPPLPHTPQNPKGVVPLGPLDNPFLSQGEKEDIIDKIKEDEGLLYINEASQLQERLDTQNPLSSVSLEEDCAFDFDSRASDSGYEDCVDEAQVSTPVITTEPKQQKTVPSTIWIRRPLAHKI